MNHVVLLGDSIFDNGAYVERGQPDVIQQVRARLPQDWQASLWASDGATISRTRLQLRNLPANATNLVISVGGNDALLASHVLFESVRTVAEATVKLSAIRDQFVAEYAAMLDMVMERNLATAVGTIYRGRADDEMQQHVNETALAVLNDVITREAFARGLALIDLRLICHEPWDYANPIEPSARGGEKIAAAIVEVVTGHSNLPRSQVFTSARARRTAQDAIRSSTNQERL
jgi:hypothetical protein